MHKDPARLICLNILYKRYIYLGEELVVTHVGRGIDEVGTLQVDIEVNGEVPLMQPEASVYIEPFEGVYIMFILLLLNVHYGIVLKQKTII
jgi:hypothetical protein